MLHYSTQRLFYCILPLETVPVGPKGSTNQGYLPLSRFIGGNNLAAHPAASQRILRRKCTWQRVYVNLPRSHITIFFSVLPPGFSKPSTQPADCGTFRGKEEDTTNHSSDTTSLSLALLAQLATLVGNAHLQSHQASHLPCVAVFQYSPSPYPQTVSWPRSGSTVSPSRTSCPLHGSVLNPVKGQRATFCPQYSTQSL